MPFILAGVSPANTAVLAACIGAQAGVALSAGVSAGAFATLSSCAAPPASTHAPPPLQFPPSPAAVASVTAPLALQGVDLLSFTTDNVVSGIASAAGVDGRSVNVTVSDFPMLTTLSLNVAGRRSLLQLSSAVQSACQGNLTTGGSQCKVFTTAPPPPPGKVAARGRRLLQASTFFLSFSGVGTTTGVALVQQAAITDASRLSVLAATLGINSASTSPPIVTAQLIVSVVASSAAAAAAIGSAVNNVSAVSDALAATGLAFSSLEEQPVVGASRGAARPGRAYRATEESRAAAAVSASPSSSDSTSGPGACPVSTLVDFSSGIAPCTLNASQSACSGCLHALAKPLLFAGMGRVASPRVTCHRAYVGPQTQQLLARLA